MQLIIKQLGIFVLTISLLLGCDKKQLVPVTVKDFKEFVAATNYVTDAEKFGWSVIQLTVHEFKVVENIDWRLPDSLHLAQDNYQVTQISYNDALAYAKWANVEIPDYETYWEYAQKDTRSINSGGSIILPVNQVNLIGNVWEITKPDQFGNVRLAGGSYLCNTSSCNGTDQKRKLIVDVTTGNHHIGFAVLK